MPIEVELPDGRVVEFPDGTDNATMERALSQFSTQPQQPKASVAPDQPANPTDGMSGFDRFAAGMGKSAMDTYLGLKQFGTQAARAWLQRPGADGAPIIRALDASISRQQDEIDEARKLDAPLMDTGAGFAGNVVGTIGQIVGPGLAFRGTAAGAALLPRTVGGNAAQGAVIGGVQPVATGDNRLANLALGGTLGAGGAALPLAGGYGVRGIRSLTGGATESSATRRAGEILRSEATNPLAVLSQQRSGVPGVNRTLGEESLDPGLMALENTIRASQRGVFDPIDTSNNVARVQALQRIAGSDADMAAAVAARDVAAGAARDQAMQAGPVGLTQTMDAVSSAIESQQGRPAVQGALRQVQSLLQQADGTPESRIAVLDNVRMTIGDMLSGKYGGENAAALRGSRELIAIRDSLNQEIGDQVPSFAAYLDAYRNASKPINRMQLGREMLERGSAPVPDDLGLPRLTPGAFSRASGDLDQTAARATGFNKAKASDILTQDDIGLIKAIQDDMQRQFRRQSSATAGSQTFERLDIESRIGRSMASRLPAVGGFVNFFEQQATQRVKERLAYLMANPDRARQVIAALPPADRAVVNQALLQLSARPAAAAPALTE